MFTKNSDNECFCENPRNKPILNNLVDQLKIWNSDSVVVKILLSKRDLIGNYFLVSIRFRKQGGCGVVAHEEHVSHVSQ